MCTLRRKATQRHRWGATCKLRSWVLGEPKPGNILTLDSSLQSCEETDFCLSFLSMCGILSQKISSKVTEEVKFYFLLSYCNVGFAC